MQKTEVAKISLKRVVRVLNEAGEGDLASRIMAHSHARERGADFEELRKIWLDGIPS